MTARAKEYLTKRDIKGLSPEDVDSVGKAIIKFEELDVNKDGTLCKQELRELILGTGLKLDNVMSVLDLDNNGKVSLDEFMTGIVLVKVENLYRPIFNEFDTDGDGHIELDDLLKIMEGKGYSREAILRFIRERDMDMNNKLSYDEFLKYFFHLRRKQ